MSQPEQNSTRWPFPWILVIALVAGLSFYMRSMRSSPMVDKKAPPFNLEVVAGDGRGDDSSRDRRVNSAQFAGKVVVLDFWATWCDICKRSTPKLNKLSKDFANQAVLFYGINIEPGDRLPIENGARSFGFQFPVLHDRFTTVQRDYAVKVLPTVVVIDRDGVVNYVSYGAPTELKLRQAIAKLL